MTTASVMPLLPEATPATAPAAEPEASTRDFEEHLSDAAAEDEAPQEATAEAATDEPREVLQADDRAEVPDEDPVVEAVAALVWTPGAPPVETQAAPAEAQEAPAQAAGEAPAAAPPPADDGSPELLQVEELPPESALREAAAAHTDPGEQGETEDGPESLLTDAAQAFDAEAPELDGLIEPEAVAEAATEPQDMPELPVPEPGRLRVTVDDELAVEVSKRAGRIDVAVDGSARALEEVQDLGPELAASLQELGFELGGFSQQERGGDSASGQAGDGGGDDAPAGERRATGGRLVNRLA